MDTRRYVMYTGNAESELEEAEKRFYALSDREVEYRLRRAEIWAELARAAAKAD